MMMNQQKFNEVSSTSSMSPADEEKQGNTTPSF